MQISLEVPPQKEITGVEVGGSGWPVVTSEGIATHYSSVKLAIQQAEIISCDVAASMLERVFFWHHIPLSASKFASYFGIFSIKHDLARSCFQLWPKIANEGRKISRKKTGDN